jgi:xylulose-5-phosphate/fructose-6-phosphate phosphoketolase
VADHCLRSHLNVNVMVADGMRCHGGWLTCQAVVHCTQRHERIWPGPAAFKRRRRHQHDGGCIVMACCGDTPTLESLAATSIHLREHRR